MNPFQNLFLPLFNQQKYHHETYQQNLLIPLLFTLLLFIFTALKITRKLRTSHEPSKSSTPNLPPGPRRLPIIGNLHLLIFSLPHLRLKNLSDKYGPLMHLKLGEVSHVVVSSPEAAKEMLRTQDSNFSQRPFLLAASKSHGLDIAFAPYGDYWRHLRRICTQELLTLKRVHSFQSIREEEVSNLIRFLHSNRGCAVNLSEKLFSLAYSITARSAFGKQCEEQEEFIAIVHEILKVGGGFNLCDVFPSQYWLRWISGMEKKLERIFEKFDQVLGNIIDEAKEDKAMRNNNIDDHYKDAAAESLLDILLNLQGNDNLGFLLETRNIKAIILDIFVGGSDTSSTVMEWAMLEMLKSPRLMEKAQAEVRKVFGRKGHVGELEFLNSVVKETIRLHPPGPLLPRESIESCVMLGYEIPAKTKFIVNAWAIGRDPKYWAEPERFYPERFIESSVDFKGTDYEFIPFGAGRRMCPGIPFAMENIMFSLAQLLFHFDWKLPDGISKENLVMNESFGLTVRRKGDLHLVPIPCNMASS